MKPESPAKENSAARISPALPSGNFHPVSEFELLLEWARIGSANVRKAPACADKHRQNLRACAGTEQRLSDLNHWRESLAFTESEKAALNLSESISLLEPEKLSPLVLAEARRHFSTEEIVRLALTIMAVNDWIDLQG